MSACFMHLPIVGHMGYAYSSPTFIAGCEPKHRAIWIEQVHVGMGWQGQALGKLVVGHGGKTRLARLLISSLAVCTKCQGWAPWGFCNHYLISEHAQQVGRKPRQQWAISAKLERPDHGVHAHCNRCFHCCACSRGVLMPRLQSAAYVDWSL